MKNPSVFIAFDLGATSGRTIMATLHPDGRLETEEINRFPNAIININGVSHWDIYALFGHIKEGLRLVAARGVTPVSVGVDTWGVDIACIAPDDTLIGLPVAYRDHRFCPANTQDFFAHAMSAEELYKHTGIQTLDFNTVFQLWALRDTFAVKAAKRIGFVPDILSWLLTGNLVTEYTIASTGAIINAATGQLDPDVLAAAGVDADKFGPLVQPGTRVGVIRPEICAETGIAPVPVIAVAGHDTGSAVAAIPADTTEGWAYLSSGTWSLMGIESPCCVVTAESRRHNMTNEGGVEGTVRVLKNITGMWILEECLKNWKKEGREYTYPELVEMARGSEPFVSFIDPDDARFVAPLSMVEAIRDYCRATGQPVPETDAQMVRTIFESLALKYRHVLGLFAEVAPWPIVRLNVIGGGSRNALLNSFTASALGIPVVAGPVECTALGNILVQAKAAGAVSTLQELRDVVKANVETTTILPDNPLEWIAPYERFCKIISH